MNWELAPISGDPETDSLAERRWTVSSLTFSFPSSADQFTGYSGGEPTNNFEVLNPTQQAAVRAIFGSLSTFTNLTFTEYTGVNASSATLRFGMTDDTSTAHAYLPTDSELGGDSWYRNTGGQYDNPIRGNYAWLTFMHEIGHALGLGHPHESSPQMLVLSDWIPYTVMSYRTSPGGSLNGYSVASGGFPQSYMMEDIAALQFLYGANFTTNSGNTVYRWSASTGKMSINGVGQGAPLVNTVFLTIWDGGGIDTYDFSNYNSTLSIDLEPGQWTRIPAQTSDLGSTLPGSIANAHLYNNDPRSLIENVIGSLGNDTIKGNSAENTLDGNTGDDYIDGFAGNDHLIGGLGRDELHGGIGNDWLEGGDGNDLRVGEEGDDILDGYVGDDDLRGFAGNDQLTGGVGNDVLAGDEGDDTLTGGDGDDRLYGGSGNDVMIGGLGNDTYRIEDAGDQVLELAGEGIDWLEISDSYLSARQPMSPQIVSKTFASSAPAVSTLQATRPTTSFSAIRGLTSSTEEAAPTSCEVETATILITSITKTTASTTSPPSSTSPPRSTARSISSRPQPIRSSTTIPMVLMPACRMPRGRVKGRSNSSSSLGRPHFGHWRRLRKHDPRQHRHQHTQRACRQ